jgi:hypothetical protein
MSASLRVVGNLLRPTSTSQCDMMDKMGPCCHKEKESVNDRVCGTAGRGIQSSPPSQSSRQLTPDRVTSTGSHYSPNLYEYRKRDTSFMNAQFRSRL